MAERARSRSANVPGLFFVDETCIDCDTCRWMAPDIFARVDGQSAVVAQPQDDVSRSRAAQALVACPTASIGLDLGVEDAAAVVRDAAHAFPVPVDDAGIVFHCGYHSESSFGAASWFIRRPEGNVLVDSPRFASPLVKRMEELGGIDLMVLTHRDDVADHFKFADRFGCRRVLHKDDVTAATKDVEMQPEGDEIVDLGGGLRAIPVPGHTKGHMVFHYRDKYLFTGDHMAWSSNLGHLYAFRGACWYSWDALKVSMQRLQDVPFEWVLPGHGRLHHTDVDTMRSSLQACIKWMATV